MARIFRAILVARGLFGFAIGTLFAITGVIMTVSSIVGGYDHEWYVGPIGVLLGASWGGYFSIYSAWRNTSTPETVSPGRSQPPNARPPVKPTSQETTDDPDPMQGFYSKRRR
jgi:hypothetical protein